MDFPRQLVTDCYGLVVYAADLLQTCYGEVANLLRTCYGETGVMDFGHKQTVVFLQYLVSHSGPKYSIQSKIC